MVFCFLLVCVYFVIRKKETLIGILRSHGYFHTAIFVFWLLQLLTDYAANVNKELFQVVLF